SCAAVLGGRALQLCRGECWRAAQFLATLLLAAIPTPPRLPSYETTRNHGFRNGHASDTAIRQRSANEGPPTRSHPGRGWLADHRQHADRIARPDRDSQRDVPQVWPGLPQPRVRISQRLPARPGGERIGLVRSRAELLLAWWLGTSS